MKRKHVRFEVAYSSNSWVATFVETDLNKKKIMGLLIIQYLYMHSIPAVLLRNIISLPTKSHLLLSCKFICDALRDLVPFVQFKKREKHPWRSVNFSKDAG